MPPLVAAVDDEEINLIDMNRINALGAHLDAAAAETGIDFCGVQFLRLIAPVVAVATHLDRVASGRPLEWRPRELRKLIGPPTVRRRRARYS